jgi:hypothetical protein
MAGNREGINKIIFDTTTEAVQVSSLSIAGDISSLSATRAGMYDENGNLWFGTVSDFLNTYRIPAER